MVASSRVSWAGQSPTESVDRDGSIVEANIRQWSPAVVASWFSWLDKVDTESTFLEMREL